MKSRSTDEPLSTGPGFNGEFHEPGMGWQILGNGYRVYNPVLMRFHSPDNLSPFDAGGLNGYMYCAGDPVNRIDPSGHTWWGKLISRLKGRMSNSSQAGQLPEMLRMTAVKGKPERLVYRTGNDLENIERIHYVKNSQWKVLSHEAKIQQELYEANKSSFYAPGKIESRLEMRRADEALKSILPSAVETRLSVRAARRGGRIITSTSQARLQKTSDAIVAEWRKTGNYTAMNTAANALPPAPVNGQAAAIRQSRPSKKSVRFQLE